VGKVSKEKEKESGRRGEYKVPRKKTEIRGEKKLGSGLIRDKEGQRKNANL